MDIKKISLIISIVTLLVSVCACCIAGIALSSDFTTVISWGSEILNYFQTIEVEVYRNFYSYPPAYLILNTPSDNELIHESELRDINLMSGNYIVILARNLHLEELALKNKIPFLNYNYHLDSTSSQRYGYILCSATWLYNVNLTIVILNEAKRSEESQTTNLSIIG